MLHPKMILMKSAENGQLLLWLPAQANVIFTNVYLSPWLTCDYFFDGYWYVYEYACDVVSLMYSHTETYAQTFIEKKLHMDAWFCMG